MHGSILKTASVIRADKIENKAIEAIMLKTATGSVSIFKISFIFYNTDLMVSLAISIPSVPRKIII